MGEEEEEEDEQETRGDPRPASPSNAEKYILVSSRQLSCGMLHVGVCSLVPRPSTALGDGLRTRLGV